MQVVLATVAPAVGAASVGREQVPAHLRPHDDEVVRGCVVREVADVNRLHAAEFSRRTDTSTATVVMDVDLA